MNPRNRTLGGWAVLLIAALVCALGGWSYAQARGDDDLSYAKSRDAALADGRQALARLNSLDGKDATSVDAGLSGWLDSATGPLYDQLKRTRKKDAADLHRPAPPRAARSPTPRSPNSTTAPAPR